MGAALPQAGSTSSSRITNTTNSGETGVFPTPLTNIVVTDNHLGAVIAPLSKTTLEPGEIVDFTGYYIPTNADFTGECAEDASFSDTVTASGVDPILGGSDTDTATANCDLCDENCE